MSSEAIPTKNATHKVVTDFLEQKILTRFGCPKKITADNGPTFRSLELSTFCMNQGIVLSHSSNHYPQGNGLVESNNKNLIAIMKKIVGDNKRTWDTQIKYVLWIDRIFVKHVTGKSFFELVYGV